MPRALDLFPPLLHHYLGRRSTFPPFSFFLSFEDALWSILEEVAPDKTRPVLVPAFFCTDVTIGLESRGFKTISYELDETLMPIGLESLITEHQPSIVFLYHPLGKRIPLTAESPVIKAIPTDSLFIEDCVDLILSPADIRFYSERHIIIDSLRKTTPLQGSRVFLPKGFAKMKGALCPWYRTRALFLHLLVRLLHGIGQIANARALLVLKWNLFSLHSDGIGKSQRGAKGFWFDKVLSEYIDHRLVKEKKGIISEAYITGLHEAFGDTYPIVGDESGDMRFFAVMLSKGAGEKIAAAAEAKEIYIDIHFDDAPHCKDRDCLLLPLSPDMTTKDVSRIITFLKEHL